MMASGQGLVRELLQSFFDCAALCALVFVNGHKKNLPQSVSHFVRVVSYAHVDFEDNSQSIAFVKRQPQLIQRMRG